MTKEQTAQLIEKLVGLYPEMKTNRGMIPAWAEVFHDMDYQRCMEGVSRWVRTCDAAPKSCGEFFRFVRNTKQEVPAAVSAGPSSAEEYYRKAGLVKVRFQSGPNMAIRYVRPEHVAVLYPDAEVIGPKSNVVSMESYR